MSRRIFLTCAFCLLASFASAQQPPVDYVIGPQDVLSVTVFDQPELTGKFTVELDGTFTYPLVGRVQAGGITIREFEGVLREKLADGFLKNPQVTVAVDQYQSQRVFVIGEVRTAGTYPLAGEMTLIEAIARAGSTTPGASDEVLVVRGGSGAQAATLPDESVVLAGKEIIRVNLKSLQSGGANAENIRLRDGDTIYVARAEQVYVFGEVRNPGSYPVRSDSTVLQVLSLAGGVTPTGAMNRIRITRLVNGEREELRVDLSDLVRPEDTIIVPERFF